MQHTVNEIKCFKCGHRFYEFKTKALFLTCPECRSDDVIVVGTYKNINFPPYTREETMQSKKISDNYINRPEIMN